MQPNPDQDPGNLRVSVRSDLSFTLQQGKPPYYIVEDALNNRFYRLGIPEWAFVSALDGKKTIREALRVSTEKAGDAKLGGSDAFSLVQWLVSNGLGRVIEEDAAHPMAPKAAKPRPKPSPLKNPLFVKVPLGNPDLFLTNSLALFHWMLGAPFFILWLFVCGFGLFQISANWEQFTSSLSNVFAPNNWLYLFLTWTLLKIVHELWHGLVCKRYGGNVPRFGLMFILFSPIAFVDVTSSWRFRSKWQRIYTAAAGMYIEFFIAGIAACVWSWSESPIVAHICHNIVLSASVSTILFNANFLMRFDGYYILTDLLEIQNLYPKGQQYINSLGRKYVLGLPAKPLSGRRGHQVLIKLYGWGSLIWRWVFYVGIIIVAAKMFGGAGIILAASAAAMWFALPALRLILFVVFGRNNERPSRVRFALAVSLIAGCILASSYLPWPGGLVAPGVVEFASLQAVRAESSGFVDQILVTPGDTVSKGQPLFVLRDAEATQKLRDIELEIQQSMIRSDVHLEDGETTKYLAELRNRSGLDERREELRLRVERLIVRAPIDGQILGQEFHNLEGEYIELGQELLAIADENDKEILISIPQADVAFLKKQLTKPVRVRVAGGYKTCQSAKLTEIQPKATSQLPHAALSSLVGGPLTVKAVSDESAGQQLELVEPRFTAKVSLPRSDSLSLYSGQRTKVRIARVGETIGQHLYNASRDWIIKKSKMAEAAG